MRQSRYKGRIKGRCGGQLKERMKTFPFSSIEMCTEAMTRVSSRRASSIWCAFVCACG